MADVPVTFTSEHGAGNGEWNLRGPAAVLVPNAIVTVSKRAGKPVRKVVGRVLWTGTQGGVELAIASIHPTMTVALAERAAKKAAKAAQVLP